MKLRVRTPSRLQWGLLRPARKADGGRSFGGMGLTIEGQGVVLEATEAAEFSWSGLFGNRVEEFVCRYLESASRSGLEPVQPAHIEVVSAPPSHCGLGSGTQLALAIAWALAYFSGHSQGVSLLAGHMRRALRSSLGCQGFAMGGLLLDPGQQSAGSGMAEPEKRVEFPKEWPILVVIAENCGSWFGNRETVAFKALHSPESVSVAMERLAVNDILPAVRNRDFASLGDPVHEFNRLAGEAFSSVQGGAYSSPAIAEIVESLRVWGIRGVGQSSWGPCVFGLLADSDEAIWVKKRLQFSFPGRVWISRARKIGADMELL